MLRRRQYTSAPCTSSPSSPAIGWLASDSRSSGGGSHDARRVHVGVALHRGGSPTARCCGTALHTRSRRASAGWRGTVAMMAGVHDFGAFIAERLGCEPPLLIQPGRFVRFATNGKLSDDAGWAKLFPDGDGGIVGDFRTGESWTWQAKREQQFTKEEK